MQISGVGPGPTWDGGFGVLGTTVFWSFSCDKTVLGILLMDLVILFGLFIDLSSYFFFFGRGGRGGNGVIE